ncbi:phenylalanine--tRNA ligase subunit beta, partial [Mycoplasmopsis pullorum]
MILSLNYLNKFFANRNLEVEETVKALNKLGFEVEEYKKFANISGLKFGYIKSIEANPNSDRLTVAQVEHADGIATVQTTDTVLKIGDFVVFFAVGATKDGFTFESKKLKGIESQGMFAAWNEIGYDHSLIDNNGDHILRLPHDFANLSDDPVQKLGLDDYLIEISLTANRNDANSYYFVARELASYFDLEFVYPFAAEQLRNDFVSEIQANNGIAESLTFFEAKNLENVNISWEDKLLLARHGINSNFAYPINLTNLCLLITGAPAHVYSKNKITNQITTQLYSGNLEILGNKEVQVDQVLAIMDSNGPISIASVMGLEKSKASEMDQDVVFEIGIFDSQLVRHGAKEIKIHSNSANQASRKITQEVANLGLHFLKSLIQNHSQVSQFINYQATPAKREIAQNDYKIGLYAGLNNLEVFNGAIAQLSKLGFEFDKQRILVPNYRYDVVLFEDIIEEIFRFHSYDNFQPTQPDIKPLKTVKRNIDKDLLMSAGYNEIRTFSLVSKDKNTFNPFNFANSVELLTFVSKEREVVRNSLAISMQEVIEYNQKRKITNLNLFEFGMINDSLKAVILASTTKDFVQIQQDLVNFLKVNNLKFVPLKDNALIHPNVSALIYQDEQLIGWIGKIHPQFDTTNAFYAEVILERVNSVTTIKHKEQEYQPLKSIDLTFTLAKRDYIEKYI